MQAFLDMYKTLHAGNLHMLKEVYREDICFVDPAHEIQGIDRLTQYFQGLYQNVRSISFTFAEPMIAGHEAYVRWIMEFIHPRLAGGRPVTVEGVSYIKWDDAGLIFYHRDYFDLGALLYEHVPLLGQIIRNLKKGLDQ